MFGAFPNSRLAVALRRLRGRFGIAAPRVAVTTHVPWYWRLLSAVLVLGTSLALAGWVYDAGRRFAGFDRSETDQEIKSLRESLTSREAELEKLRSVANAGESQLQIERTTSVRLTEQVKALEADNARLKEDLALFENMAATEEKGTGVSIHRLQVDRTGAPGEYRYRMLTASQGPKRDREFRGSLRFLVSAQQSGKAVMITLPQPGDARSDRFSVSFKHFRRLEGSFQLPPDATLTGVEAQLLQEGTVVAQQQLRIK